MSVKAYFTAVMNKNDMLRFSNNVRTVVRRARQFCCSFVANLLQYLLPKIVEM